MDNINQQEVLAIVYQFIKIGLYESASIISKPYEIGISYNNDGSFNGFCFKISF